MSGDHGPQVTVPAALDALRTHPEFTIVLVGDDAGLRPLVDSAEETLRNRIEIRPASQVVGMDELPTQALRGKRDSSMRVAIELVKSGEAAACVSAGNTGALMATARYVLKMLPGIDRPAICSGIPAVGGHTFMLDLGANADCTAEHLLEFAVMGSALASAVEGNSSPRVALLNIGEEQIKGNERVKLADRYLAQSGLNYCGYVEGHHISSGTVDVIVTDGFAGNVALKTIEGTARYIGQMLREEFERGPVTRLEGLFARPTLQRLARRLDPQRYNGASFLGLRAIVVKSHGGAERVGFATAIRAALIEVEQAVPERISAVLARTHVAGPSL
jgi:phosphate acyltransferase